MAAAMVSGALLINEHYRMAWQNGGALNWTDAVFSLSKYVKTAKPERVFCADWGMLDTLRLLNRGKLPLTLIYDAAQPDRSPDEERIRNAAATPGAIFLAHVPGFEYMEGANARLVKTAGDLGFKQEMLAVIADDYGRPTYQVYRFAQPAAAAVSAR
jgi:hypothetical protein